MLFAKQPKIALEKSFAHFFLLNCSGVMALHIKKKFPRDNSAQRPWVLVREQTTSVQNRKETTCHTFSQNCSFSGIEDVQIRWISFPTPSSCVLPCQEHGYVQKTKKAILGAPQAIAKCCITVSQENVFLRHYQPDLPEHKCFYLHAHKHTVIMHAIEICSFDHLGHGGHLINMINMQTFGCLFK